MNLSSGRVQNRNLSLHYHQCGEPGGAPVVLIHGGRDHGRTWDRVARALSAHWRVIIPDLRGHGDSDHSSDGHYPMDAYVADLDALIDGLALATVRLIGHSLGGNIALRYAGARPDRVERLVAIEGLGAAPKIRRTRDAEPMGPRMQTWLERRKQAAQLGHRRYATIADAAERLAQAQPQLGAADIERLTRHGVRANEDGTWSWKFDPMIRADPPADLDTAQMQGLWSRIECPVMLVYGKDSWASDPSADGRAAHFRDAIVLNYENAGHWVHYDQPDRFVADARSFLA